MARASLSSIDDSLLASAVAILQTASKSRPADLVLRERLRHAGLSHAQTRQISRAVFSFYRWFGWLDHARPLRDQLEQGIQLAADYDRQPQSFSDHALMTRAVPVWSSQHFEVSSAWVRVIQSEPRLWLRARPGQGRELAAKLAQAKVAALPDAVLYLGGEDLFRRHEFQAGEFEIQDIASQAVSILCAPKPGQTWWDACAGEGGKTLHLSDLMKNQGMIWASDRARWRLRRLKLRARRAHCFNYRIAPWDGTEAFPTKTRFDGVLVDAPCSGVGTWQRNPHARWTTTPQDVRELAEIQKHLLEQTAGSLKPGGTLIYAVCTLTRAETVEVADHADKALRGFEPHPLRDPANPNHPSATRRWIRPQDLGGNGMFVAAWRRTV